MLSDKIKNILRKVLVGGMISPDDKMAILELLENEAKGNTEKLKNEVGGIRVIYEHYKEIGDFAKAGRRIEAIKILREVSGVGLKEAKDAVDKEFPATPYRHNGW